MSGLSSPTPCCCRSLKFVANFYKGTIPESKLNEGDVELMAMVNRELALYLADMNKIKLVIFFEGFGLKTRSTRIGNMEQIHEQNEGR